MGAGVRDSMVPIPDKIDLAELEEVNRRQLRLLIAGFVNSDPRLLGVGVAREESPVKITITPHAPHDLVNRGRLQGQGILPGEQQGPLKLVEW